MKARHSTPNAALKTANHIRTRAAKLCLQLPIWTMTKRTQIRNGAERYVNAVTTNGMHRTGNRMRRRHGAENPRNLILKTT